MNKLQNKDWLLWLLLFFIAPIGILLMWIQKKDWSTKKKGVLTAVFLVWFLIIILISGGNDETQTSDTNETPVTVEESAPTDISDSSDEDVPVADQVIGYEVNTADVLNGSKNEVIGQRGYIEIPADELKNMSESDFSELCDYVDTHSYNWFSVIASDGTGLQFTGGQTEIVDYGELDDEGCIEKQIGYIKKESGTYSYMEAE